MMQLPDHLWKPQREAIASVFDALRSGRKSGLIVLPTGTGKTTMFLTFARLLDVPTMVLVHRDYLIEQTAEEAAAAWPGASVGVIQGDRNSWHGRQLVVASVQSLHADRLAELPRDRWGLLISDEAHRSVARGWSAAIAHFAGAGFHLGVTATPDRLDGRGLAKHFGPEPLYVYTVRQAMLDGVLVPVRQYAVKTGVLLDGVKQDDHGKWDTGELSHAVSTTDRNRQTVEAYQRYAGDRRAVAFCVDVEHVHAMTAAFESAGIPAVAITGQDRKNRAAQLADFRAGKYRVLVNCEVAIEGFNDRAVSCVIMARPTKSRLFYMQAVGRGLRKGDGKQDCIVIDVVDVTRLHKLVTLCNLLGVRKTHDAQGQDVMALAHAEEQEGKERVARELEQASLFPLAWAAEEVSPWPDLPSLNGYEPQWDWQVKPATEKQLKALARMGLDLRRDLTKGEASWLFDRAREYDFVFPTPATPAQERFLRRAGEWQDDMSKREASRLIFRLKQEVA